jgi:hypothetical protein
MADNDSRTVRIPLFDGKSKGFVLWWIRFKAYAKERKFSQALGSTPEKDLPVMQEPTDKLDSSDVDNKKAIEAMARNEKALSNLAVAFTTSKAMVHHHKAACTEWPDGLACNVMKSLLKKYQLQDIISGIEYENALRSFKLKKGQDPTELFDHITEVNTQYGIDNPDENFGAGETTKALHLRIHYVKHGGKYQPRYVWGNGRSNLPGESEQGLV